MLKTVILSLFFLVSLSSMVVSQEKPLLLVSLEQKPIAYTEDGIVKGIAVDIIYKAFQKMNVPIRVKIYPFKRALNAVKYGDADAIFSVVKTPEIQGYLFYGSQVLISQDAVLFVRRDSNINYNGDFSNLGEYRFGILRAATYGRLWADAIQKGQINKIEAVNDYVQNIMKLHSRRIDIIVGPRFSTLDKIRESNFSGEIKELGPPLESVPTYMAFSRIRTSQDLVRRFDQALLELRQKADVDSIVDSYLTN